MKNVLILGATSAIAQAVARRLAERGYPLYLVARSQEKLETVAQDLRVRGAESVWTATADLRDASKHQALLEHVLEAFQNRLDTVFIAYGTLSNQDVCERDAATAVGELGTNFTSVVSLLTPVATLMEKQKRGQIAVISSVAGDRGRASNYVYGAAKGALNIFLEGLRHRLFKAGVQVLTIKPGFVDTPMTAHLGKNALYSTPEAVARDIVEALDRGRSVIYTPSFWRWIMLLIKRVPNPIFYRTRL